MSKGELDQSGPQRVAQLTQELAAANKALLAAAERNLQLTIDSIPALAWSANADGTGDFFNQHYLDYVGLPLEQVHGWRWSSVVHPDDLGIIHQAWESFRAAGVGGEVEARVRRHDGVYRWFLFRSKPLRDEQGKIIKWFGINTDIEDRKRAETLLAGEKQLLESIAAGRSLRDVLNTLCTVVEAASPGCHCEVRTTASGNSVFGFGVAPSLPASFVDSICGSPVRGVLSPSSLAVEQKMPVIAENIETDPRWRESPIQVQLLEHGLKSVWSTPVFSKAGSVLGTLCVYHREPSSPRPHSQDIVGRATHIASIAIERLQAEDELRKREQLLTVAERISLTGSFAWDLDADVVVFSDQLRRIYEFEDGFDMPRPDQRKLIHPDDLPMVDGKIAQAFNGQDGTDSEMRLLMPDGRIKHIRTTSQVIHHEDGRKECIGVVQDISRRWHAEDALDTVRSELAHVTRVTSLGELAASIAHEVNQPLSGIVTNADACLQMLSSDAPDIQGAITTMRRTIRDGYRASEVVKRLRGLFHKSDYVLEPVDLNEAAREVMALCSHDLQRRRIAVLNNLDDQLPAIKGDRVQLQQVVLNLVLNAADALEGVDSRPRQIVIETSRVSPDRAQLSVRDTGRGIAPGDLAKVFEAFYTTKPKGMGIGLSVSKSILDRHDGKLWASANDGPGSTFSFSIPFVVVQGG